MSWVLFKPHLNKHGPTALAKLLKSEYWRWNKMDGLSHSFKLKTISSFLPQMSRKYSFFLGPQLLLYNCQVTWKFLSPRKLFCFQMPDQKWNEESSRAQGGLVLRSGFGGIAHWLPAIHKAFVQCWAVQVAAENWCLGHCSWLPKGEVFKVTVTPAGFVPNPRLCTAVPECLGVVEGSASTASRQNLLPGLVSRSPLQAP